MLSDLSQVSRNTAFERSGWAVAAVEEHWLLMAPLIFPPCILSQVTCWSQVLIPAPVFLWLLHHSCVLNSSHASSKQLSKRTFHRPKDMSCEKEFAINNFFMGDWAEHLATNAGWGSAPSCSFLLSPLSTCVSLGTTRAIIGLHLPLPSKLQAWRGFHSMPTQQGHIRL